MPLPSDARVMLFPSGGMSHFVVAGRTGRSTSAAADSATRSVAIHGLGKIRIWAARPMITIDRQIFKPELREST